jgi:hypothetical protein
MHDKGPDSTAPNRFEPPIFKLYKQLTHEVAAAKQKVVEQAVKGLPDADKPGRLEQMAGDERLDAFTVFYQDQLQPAQVMGSEQTVIKSINSPESDMGRNLAHYNVPYHQIRTVLYHDGSPYIPDEFLAEDPVLTDPEMVIAISPEMRPVIIPFVHIEKMEFPTDGGATTSEAYLRALEASGKQPHYLSDEDISALSDVIPSLMVDMHETLNAHEAQLHTIIYE